MKNAAMVLTFGTLAVINPINESKRREKLPGK
jgi:hypothetical protein